MSMKSDGVKGYKQIHFKRFSKVISHNLRLLAMSRDLNLYELHTQIISDYVANKRTIQIQKKDYALYGEQQIQNTPDTTPEGAYNIFISPEAQQQASELSAKLHVTESDILYSALVSFAREHKLSQPLEK
ncbi:hypothetical protein [Citrobacter sp. Cpo150]|uniref:hypothetical protein n=1 Tax=Citrobacter sp. Cpo150 TaxID=2985154 RepID=UPI0025765107|nr:hypothetical protein [Citrobacter sp. Cpo150]MDM2765702.1 hypothetical protein [Citrobacter sp. Cpo150]